jgi:hypothetical protein
MKVNVSFRKIEGKYRRHNKFAVTTCWDKIISKRERKTEREKE